MDQGMDDVRLWEATPGKLQGSVVPAPVEGEAERIVLWTQVITGMKLDDDGAVRVLDAPTWRQRRQRLEEMGGPPIAAVASDSPQTAAEASGSPPRQATKMWALTRGSTRW